MWVTSQDSDGKPVVRGVAVSNTAFGSFGFRLLCGWLLSGLPVIHLRMLALVAVALLALRLLLLRLFLVGWRRVFLEAGGVEVRAVLVLDQSIARAAEQSGGRFRLLYPPAVHRGTPATRSCEM